MPNLINNLTGRAVRELKRKGTLLQNKADTYSSLEKKILRRQEYKNLERQIARTEKAFLDARSESRWTRAGAIGLAGSTAGSYAYNKSKKEDQLKSKLVDKAQGIYTSGVQDGKNRTLLELQKRDLLKTSSVLGLFTAKGFRTARKTMKDSSKILNENLDNPKIQQVANETFNKSRNKMWLEGAKTLGVYGVTGAAAYKANKLRKKEASFKIIPVTTGLGAISGATAAWLTPELETNAKHIGEGALTGAAVGAGMGIVGATAAKYRHRLPELKMYLEKVQRARRR